MTRERRDAWRDRRRSPLTVTLDGRTIDVGEHPARVWVLAVLSEEPADWLLDALDADTAAELWEDATDPDHPLTAELLHDIGRAVVARVAGRPWWQVTHLVASLVEGWESFDGLAADRGLGDPLDWPLERLCNWVYFRMTRHADEEERSRIDAALAAPEPGVTDPAGGEDADAGEGDAAAWLAAAGQAGVSLG